MEINPLLLSDQDAAGPMANPHIGQPRARLVKIEAECLFGLQEIEGRPNGGASLRKRGL